MRAYRPDWVLLLLPWVMFGASVVFVHSASAVGEAGISWSSTHAIRQALWMSFAFTIMMISLRFSYRYLLDYAWFLYGLTIVLLLVVFFMPARLGAHRWIDLGFMNFQPSELAKLAVPAALAAFLKERQPGPMSFGRALVAVAIAAVPMLLILKEPDLGTSLLFIPTTLAILLLAGLRKKWILIAVLAGALVSPVLYHELKEYQKQRIQTFMNPYKDPLGAGYNIIQSRIAIGSGGLIGKGLFSGSQTQLEFLPERHTDFIFSVVTEEGGFVAGIAIILCYWTLIIRGLRTADRCPHRFGKLLGVGIITLLGAQAVINIGMTMGLLPVVGMPLFIVSYGGSSLLTSLFMIGILINIGMRRDL